MGSSYVDAKQPARNETHHTRLSDSQTEDSVPPGVIGNPSQIMKET